MAYTRRFGVKLIAITSRPGSALGSAADVGLFLPVAQEACPNGLAPTTSTTMQMVAGDALAVLLLERRGFTSIDFQRFHPGGKLGARLSKARSVMHTGDELPVVADTADLSHAIVEMTSKRFGITGVVNAAGDLIGVLTDGDLRRATLAGVDAQAALASLPGRPPICADLRASMRDVLDLMDRHRIDHVPVVDAAGRAVDLVTRRELSQRIYLSSPHLGDDEAALVQEAFRSNWIAPLGPHVDAFEREFALAVGLPHAAATSSGTAALHLGLRLLGVGPGDLVLCSSLTFVASANPIRQLGATPVFVDSEPAGWNMSPQALQRALRELEAEGRRAKAAVVVNLYGLSAEMDELGALLDAAGVPMLEDAAESLGASYHGRASGSFGRLAVFSFNGNKIITTSGGGMLVGADEQLIAHARKLSTQAREPARHYEHVEDGYNYRMSNVLAGIGRGQLRVLAQRVAARRAVFERYRAEFSGRALRWMAEPAGHHATRWLSAFVLELPQPQRARDLLLDFLERHNVEARPVWKPMHLQPLYADCRYHAHDDDVSGALFAGGVCLPSGSNLDAAQLDRVCALLHRGLDLVEAQA
ncbi:putative pyridoxal phosphate-dependent aminotransferase EpsN [mine drainage metagenome]|uniref:Putative pyridoxal phosphate-dependent aminotransferase EpsN n=1 Tax=mine drainage metagenome TaxID=410659 RepID=A0A1J5PT37_9ZZZZ